MKRTTSAARKLIAIGKHLSVFCLEEQARISRVNVDKLLDETIRLLLVESVIHEESK